MKKVYTSKTTQSSNVVYNALKVVQLNPAISEFIKQNDPKAWEQINEAIKEHDRTEAEKPKTINEWVKKEVNTYFGFYLRWLDEKPSFAKDPLSAASLAEHDFYMMKFKAETALIELRERIYRENVRRGIVEGK